MGTIQIKKIEKTVTTGKIGQERQKVSQKTLHACQNSMMARINI